MTSHNVIYGGVLIEWMRDASTRSWEIYISPTRDYLGEDAICITFADYLEPIVRHGTYPAEGLPFHPEVDGFVLEDADGVNA